MPQIFKFKELVSKMEYKNIEEIQDKIHKSFTKSLVKKGLQNMSTGLSEIKNTK